LFEGHFILQEDGGHFILQEDGGGCGCVDESLVLTARYAVVMFV
jgi:hypothetical protein